MYSINEKDSGLKYRLYSLSESGEITIGSDPRKFLVKAENYGVPQAGHRMFIVGVRSDLNGKPKQLPAFTPHSFRHMIVSKMYARKLSIAKSKAWSQNLGHESAMTMLTSYGKLSLHEQGELVRQSPEQNKDDLVEEIRRLINKNQ